MNHSKIFGLLLSLPVLTGISLANFTLPAQADTVNVPQGYKGKVCVNIGNSRNNRTVQITWGNWNYTGKTSGNITATQLIELNSRGYVNSFTVSGVSVSKYIYESCPGKFPVNLAHLNRIGANASFDVYKW